MLASELDPSILTGLREGDIGSLAEVFKLYGHRVYRLTRRMMGNEVDAEDAAQEIFLRVFEQAGKFDGRSRFSTWLYRLAVRHCLNRIEQRNRKEALEHRAAEHARAVRVQSAPSPLESVVNQEEGKLLDSLLESLPGKYRSCLVLREVEGLSYAEIGEILEVPVGTVMSRLSRAREQLRGKLLEIERAGAGPRNKPPPGVVKTKEARPDDMR